MITPNSPPNLAELPDCKADKALTLALRLAHAENALLTFTSGEVDAVLDPHGRPYLLSAAQEHLRQNESRLQALLGSVADVITVVNRGGIILYQSNAVTRVLGYAPEELLGKNIFEFIYNEERARVYSVFFHVIEEIVENATVLFRHRISDGSFITIEAAVGKLCEPASASVVLSLRPVGGYTPDRTEQR